MYVGAGTVELRSGVNLVRGLRCLPLTQSQYKQVPERLIEGVQYMHAWGTLAGRWLFVYRCKGARNSGHQLMFNLALDSTFPNCTPQVLVEGLILDLQLKEIICVRNGYNHLLLFQCSFQIIIVKSSLSIPISRSIPILELMISTERDSSNLQPCISQSDLL